MSYLPCKNPNCHSFGKPHPNCRCHGDMAEGGEAEPFCSRARPHARGCQYFADGGDAVPADDLPDDVAPPAQMSGAGEAVPPDDMPDDVVPPDDMPDESSDVVPPEDLPDAPEVSDANADLEPGELQRRMVDAAHPQGITPFEAPGQQLATVAENVAQGFAGPLATLAETKVLGVPAEDIKARADANPGEAIAGNIAGMALPFGQAKWVGKGAQAIADVARLGKVGSAAIKGAITLGGLQAANEATKAILGEGDPHNAVSPYLAVGAATVFGTLLSGGGAKLGSIVQSQLEEHGVKAAAIAESYLAGIGLASEGGTLPKNAPEWMAKGFKQFGKMPEHATDVVMQGAGAASGGLPGYLLGKASSGLVEPLMQKLIGKATKGSVPGFTRWLTGNLQGNVFNMIDYADKVARGESMIAKSVGSLFDATTVAAVNNTPRAIEKLKSYMDDGGIEQNMREDFYQQPGADDEPVNFAEGGEAKASKKAPPKRLAHESHIAQGYPEQHLLIETAKGRISQYLSAQRPQPAIAQRPFDPKPDRKQAEKRYNQALEVAAEPLGVLRRVKDGTITSDHIQHLSAMYPELSESLKKSVTERITKEQMDGKKPSYRVRQALSLFMGTPLSGELAPQNVAAAQQVFARAAQASEQQQTPQKPKRGTTSLTKSDAAFLTDDQAREKRQQKV